MKREGKEEKELLMELEKLTWEREKTEKDNCFDSEGSSDDGILIDGYRRLHHD